MADITIDQVRQQYPQYKDLSDDQLAQGLHSKFYNDMPYDAFAQKIGLQKPAPAAPPAVAGNLGASIGAAAHDVGGALDAAITPVLNAPHELMALGHNLLSRISGNGSNTSAPLEAHLGKAGQDFTAGMGSALADSPGAINPEAKAQPGGPLGGNNPVVQDVAGSVKELGGEALGATPLLGAGAVIKGAKTLGGAALDAVGPNATEGGLVTQNQNKLRAALAGPSGTTQRILQNQSVGNGIVARDIGHADDVPMTPESVLEARAPANAVYNRVANSLPAVPLDEQTMSEINSAGKGGRISRGTPAAQEAISRLQQELGSGPVTGDKVVGELTGLRQDGYANIGAYDVDKRTLGRAQVDMANALEGHIERNLPANAPVSMDQLRAARTLLAKNSTVAGALDGNDINMAALARIRKDNPGLMTDGLAHVGKFAAENPTVSTLGNLIPDTSTPSLVNDLRDVSLTKPSSYIQPVVGGLGRRMIAGSPKTNMAQSRAAFPNRGTADLAPLPNRQLALPPASMAGPPAPTTVINAGGGATTADILVHDLGLSPGVQAAGPRHPGFANDNPVPAAPEPRSMPEVHPPLTQHWDPDFPPPAAAAPKAAPPKDFFHDLVSSEPTNAASKGRVATPGENAPAANAKGSREDIPLADMLSHGVETGPAPGLTAGPMGLQHPAGIPYTLNHDFMAGDLSLADGLTGAPRENLSDVAKVKSQGVPEDIMTRTPKKASAPTASVSKPEMLADELFKPTKAHKKGG